MNKIKKFWKTIIGKVIILSSVGLIIPIIIIGSVFGIIKNKNLTINEIADEVINWSEKNYIPSENKFKSDPSDYCESLLKSNFLLNNSQSGITIENQFKQINKMLTGKNYKIDVNPDNKQGKTIINEINAIYDSIRVFGVMGCVLYKTFSNNKKLFNELTVFFDFDDFNSFFYGLKNDAKINTINKSNYLKSLLKQNENIFKSNVDTIKWAYDKKDFTDFFKYISTNCCSAKNYNTNSQKSINIASLYTIYNGYKFQQNISIVFSANGDNDDVLFGSFIFDISNTQN